MSESIRIAFVVSHPIQYYVPLYQSLAAKLGVQVKVFYTWHGGADAMHDPGFGQEIHWDLPLRTGYEFEVVRNRAADPGTHHFFGMRNPDLVDRVMDWNPDFVHLTGYSYASHLWLLFRLHKRVAILFRGDSHLLDLQNRWWLKRRILNVVYAWPTAFLCVGKNNADYYRRLGVADSKLFVCPHSIDTSRFGEPCVELEQLAKGWREELGISPKGSVLLFVGKFERKKRPVEFMRAVIEYGRPETIAVLVGAGDLRDAVQEMAALYPARFRVLPFQNQSRMPVVYRLGDVLVLPSSDGETWGLAVNEAMASGRPAVVTDRVGCGLDLVHSKNGRIAPMSDWRALIEGAEEVAFQNQGVENRQQIRTEARAFDIEVTAQTLLECARQLGPAMGRPGK